jgi:hypothetical protein
MSAELETLDQLLGGDMSLETIRGLYSDDQHFAKGIHALLANGDVRLLACDGVEVPTWQWRRLFVEGGIASEITRFRLSMTAQGIRKVT